MNKYILECVGTFILVFSGTGAIVINDVSGAHINPAVSLAFWSARMKLFLHSFLCL